MRLRWLALATYFAAAGADRSTEHAACIAMNALADIDKAEASVLEKEQKQVELVSSLGNSPISVGESYLHDALGLLFDGALSALRHALVAGVLLLPNELAEAASLDAQLSALLSLHHKEPLFFWHGPRRILLPRLRRLLGKELVKESLSESCSRGSKSPLEPAHLLRGASSTAGVVPKTLPHQVPLVGLVLGEENCGEGAACDVSEAIQQARTLNDGGAVHVLLSARSDATLSNIGAVLQGTSSVWLSAVIPPHLVENGVYISQTVTSILGSASRKHIDMLWLPYAAFTKPLWPKVKYQLDSLLRTGSVVAYGAHMPIPTSVVLKKIFEDRQPAPVAWLSSHDVLRSIDKQVAEAAHALGISVVALPRARSPLQASARAYLSLAAGQDLANQQAAHLKWMLQRRFGLAIESTAEISSVEVLQKLKEVEVTEAALEILDNARIFSQPSSSRDEADLSQSDTQSLEENLRYWQSKFPKVDASPTLKEDTASAEFRPALSESALSDLAGQADLYKRNNHAIYRENFFDDATFAAIVNETKRLWKSKDIEGNCNLDGRNRLGGYVLDHLSHETSLYKLLYGNEHFRHWVTEVNGEGTMWPSDFPIELREYGPDSRGMGCHSDLLMYAVAKKDTEFAFTVDNDSKSKSSIVDRNGRETKTLTRPNSMIMVRANAATHCVYPTQSGHRTILKFIYVGDYRKSQAFPNYKGNECGPGNVNNKLLKARRDQNDADSLEL